ncbi:hypothetical protein Z946_3828 [Sulfitobacter noctilucicola]|nr:hypothetical protein Z946_3828 [Sulfitobacter noctilucicola]
MVIVGAVFIFASKRSVWQETDRKTLEIDPIRRFYKEKFPKFDARSMSFGRVFIRIAGVLSVVVGTIIILVVVLNTS